MSTEVTGRAADAPGPDATGTGTGTAEDTPLPRDAAYWAAPVSRLVAESDAARVRGLDGKRLLGPQQGFGPLWRRRHRLRLTGTAAGPADVIREWKAHFGEFWPAGMGFHPTLAGIAPGELAALDMAIGQVCVLSTGVFVLYADETSFTYMTPQGHAFAAWITFTADQDDDGTTVAEVDMLLRPADPFVDLPYTLGAGRLEDRFWRATLTRLAYHVGARPEPVESSVECLDSRRLWRNWTNVRWFGGPRTLLHGFRAPRGG